MVNGNQDRCYLIIFRDLRKYSFLFFNVISHAEQAIGRTYRYDLYSFIDCITAETFEDKLFNNSVHKMRLSRVVDQKNPERKFTREDLNARMFIAPDPNTKTKLPEHINYENDVLLAEKRSRIPDCRSSGPGLIAENPWNSTTIYA
ncbi:hypothetical protein RhiirB3_472112 [Rhizophagus irregularis]|nr:hypothetical protein RhiirB3_472112 [Rhizophagus irregularis]